MNDLFELDLLATEYFIPVADVQTLLPEDAEDPLDDLCQTFCTMLKVIAQVEVIRTVVLTRVREPPGGP